ncbi:impact protein [Thecamonas trahens ATCC 50062]|uniref:Impact protein n=1 Tax=Thecamonas trahens ATCC 50062 TaxID=461836 RepID=A0A0L0DE57_THETB|nr:impact protein [Thecamonas trahens ATCC 50062]KNC50602.1 impact protein [Thecamonas trahens ATCC 50062]|eukprot:XP_013762489.1 impact protein [Thecamonas trahens ATCC 50062]
MASESNAERRAEELEVMAAIYADDGVFYAGVDGEAELVVRPDGCDDLPPLRLRVSFPDAYPSEAPPQVVALSAPWIEPAEALDVQAALAAAADELAGEVVLHAWIEVLREHADELVDRAVARMRLPGTVSDDHAEHGGKGVAGGEDTRDARASMMGGGRSLVVVSGKPVSEKRSKFVAHGARVRSMEDVNALVNGLLCEAKIAKATHNMLAYRFVPRGGGPLNEGRDDDGEGGAGDTMLNMLQTLGATNVAVVVTRWYGGVHLGSLRFKIIADVTKDLVTSAGWVESDESAQAAATVTKTDAEKSSGNRLRPSWEVHARIKHDPHLDSNSFTIGYVDRFTGVQEVPFDEFQTEDVYAYEGIPLHRIVYFKRDGELVWDRETRLDLLFKDSGDPRAASS